MGFRTASKMGRRGKRINTSLLYPERNMPTHRSGDIHLPNVGKLKDLSLPPTYLCLATLQLGNQRPNLSLPDTTITRHQV